MKIELLLKGAKCVAVESRGQGSGRYIRQSELGRYAEIDLVVEPRQDSSLGSFLSWEVSEQQIPLEFVDGVISGIKAVMEEEELRLFGACIRVVGGSYHAVDSSALCYQLATIQAFREALSQIGLCQKNGPTGGQ